MFLPSTSWISKAGVQLDYAPEDIDKSLLFTPSESSVDPISSKSSKLEENYVAPITSGNLESKCGSSNTVDKTRRCNLPVHPKSSTIKSAPFLRRRQGMAAWCSKIRRQGMPVRDPSEELRKNKSATVGNIQVQRHNSSQSSKDQSVPHSPGTSINCRSSAQVEKHFEEPPKNIDEFPEGTCNVTVAQSKGDSVCTQVIQCTEKIEPVNCQLLLSSHEESYTDNGELEEFEILEEIAENSSFSSVTTSFVSKLSKVAMQERLKRAEERLERLKLTGDTSHNKLASTTTHSHSQQNGDHCRLFSSASATDLAIANGPSDQDPNVVLDSSHSVTLHRSSDGILAHDNKGKSKKVARFHLAESCSIKDANSSENSNFHSRIGPISHYKSSDSQVAELGASVEFDDNQSWASEQNGSVSPEKNAVMGSILQSSEKLQSQAIVACPTGYDIERQPRRDIFPKRSDSFKGPDSHSGHSSPRRSCSRPPSAGSRTASNSRSPVRSQAKNSSYETELIGLADDFIDKIKRDPHRVGAESQTPLRQWITRLEQEVKRFKVENTNLLRMKAEREESMKRLELEAKRFEEMKAKELKLFNEYKENEMRKLKKERRVLEDFQRALKSMPSKKDREEIERLREELNDAKAEVSRREVRWHATIARLRTRIGDLESERNELKERIGRMEEERLSLQNKLTETRRASSRMGQTRRSASSSGACRQTLNSVTQALALKVTKQHDSDDQKSSRTGTNENPSQHHRQSLSSSRLSSRTSSRIGGEIKSRRSATLTASGPIPVNHQEADRINVNGTRPRSTTPVEAARESVNSGGYFTGDDDCQSATSEQAMSFDRKRLEAGEKSSYDVKVESNRALTRTIPTPPVPERVTSTKDTLPMPGTAASGKIIHSVEHADGSVEQTYSNGAVVLNYSNGSVKEIFPDKKTIVVSLFNGDIKRTLPDGRVIYHYAVGGTVQITYPDGKEEINYADGLQEVIYPKPSGPDPTTGGVIRQAVKDLVSHKLPNGDREILFPNGQREIHSVTGIKCRIYPDGTTKTVFPDGRHETRYASGRLRVKDAEGRLLIDTRLPTKDPTSSRPSSTVASDKNVAR